MGTEINHLNLSLDLSASGETMVRGYDTTLAPIRLHAVMFDDTTGALLGSRRYWKGFIDSLTITTAPQDSGSSEIVARCVSSARLGTLTRAGKKSDESQRRRSGDRFRRYGDLGTVKNDVWGTDD